jgi:hypothetical protein
VSSQRYALAALPPKDPVPIVQEAGWALRPVWKGAENLTPHRDSIPGLYHKITKSVDLVSVQYLSVAGNEASTGNLHNKTFDISVAIQGRYEYHTGCFFSVSLSTAALS